MINLLERGSQKKSVLVLFLFVILLNFISAQFDNCIVQSSIDCPSGYDQEPDKEVCEDEWVWQPEIVIEQEEVCDTFWDPFEEGYYEDDCQIVEYEVDYGEWVLEEKCEIVPGELVPIPGPCSQGPFYYQNGVYWDQACYDASLAKLGEELEENIEEFSEEEAQLDFDELYSQFPEAELEGDLFGIPRVNSCDESLPTPCCREFVAGLISGDASALVSVYSNHASCSDSLGLSSPSTGDLDENLNLVEIEIPAGPSAGTPYYCDKDGDGFFGKVAAGFVRFEGVSNPYPQNCRLEKGGDCNDLVALMNPGASETCDGVDNNCNGAVDEGRVCNVTYYCDSDSDGAFSSEISGSCNSYNCVPSNCVANAGTDCNDGNSLIQKLYGEGEEGACCSNALDLNALVFDEDSNKYTCRVCGEGKTPIKDSFVRVIGCEGDCIDRDGDGYDDCAIGEEGDDGKPLDCVDKFVDDAYGNESSLHCPTPLTVAEFQEGKRINPSDCSFEQSLCSACINPGMEEICDGADNTCDGRVDFNAILPPGSNVPDGLGGVVNGKTRCVGRNSQCVRYGEGLADGKRFRFMPGGIGGKDAKCGIFEIEGGLNLLDGEQLLDCLADSEYGLIRDFNGGLDYESFIAYPGASELVNSAGWNWQYTCAQKDMCADGIDNDGVENIVETYGLADEGVLGVLPVRAIDQDDPDCKNRVNPSGEFYCVDEDKDGYCANGILFPDCDDDPSDDSSQYKISRFEKRTIDVELDKCDVDLCQNICDEENAKGNAVECSVELGTSECSAHPIHTGTLQVLSCNLRFSASSRAEVTEFYQPIKEKSSTIDFVPDRNSCERKCNQECLDRKSDRNNFCQEVSYEYDASGRLLSLSPIIGLFSEERLEGGENPTCQCDFTIVDKDSFVRGTIEISAKDVHPFSRLVSAGDPFGACAQGLDLNCNKDGEEGWDFSLLSRSRFASTGSPRQDTPFDLDVNTGRERIGPGVSDSIDFVCETQTEGQVTADFVLTEFAPRAGAVIAIMAVPKLLAIPAVQAKVASFIAAYPAGSTIMLGSLQVGGYSADTYFAFKALEATINEDYAQAGVFGTDAVLFFMGEVVALKHLQSVADLGGQVRSAEIPPGIAETSFERAGGFFGTNPDVDVPMRGAQKNEILDKLFEEIEISYRVGDPASGESRVLRHFREQDAAEIEDANKKFRELLNQLDNEDIFDRQALRFLDERVKQPGEGRTDIEITVNVDFAGTPKYTHDAEIPGTITEGLDNHLFTFSLVDFSDDIGTPIDIVRHEVGHAVTAFERERGYVKKIFRDASYSVGIDHAHGVFYDEFGENLRVARGDFDEALANTVRLYGAENPDLGKTFFPGAGDEIAEVTDYVSPVLALGKADWSAEQKFVFSRRLAEEFSEIKLSEIDVNSQLFREIIREVDPKGVAKDVRNNLLGSLNLEDIPEFNSLEEMTEFLTKREALLLEVTKKRFSDIDYAVNLNADTKLFFRTDLKPHWERVISQEILQGETFWHGSNSGALPGIKQLEEVAGVSYSRERGAPVYAGTFDGGFLAGGIGESGLSTIRGDPTIPLSRYTKVSEEGFNLEEATKILDELKGTGSVDSDITRRIASLIEDQINGWESLSSAEKLLINEPFPVLVEVKNAQLAPETFEVRTPLFEGDTFDLFTKVRSDFRDEFILTPASLDDVIFYVPAEKVAEVRDYLGTENVLSIEEVRK